MKKIFLSIITVAIATVSFAQNTFKAKVIDEQNKEPLIGAGVSIDSLLLGASTDTAGFATIKNIPEGKFQIHFHYIGYNDFKKQFQFPLTNPIQVFEIELEPNASKLNEVVVSTTRSSRTIDDISTRVETISAAELEEKTSMQPSNAKMLLTESTGIQTQQTSATSANASIRIQGLDGKYTQLLKDGFPLYSGFSGGLSIVQIPPLDLKRVEVIKGASSTLYGGGAIAGLINFITKIPTEKKNYLFLLMQTILKHRTLADIIHRSSKRLA